MGGLSLFLFKEGSRNQFNNDRASGHFAENYRQMFDMKLPHLDGVDDLLRYLPFEKLEQIKMDLMSHLFEQKWLRKYRLLGKYYLVSVDATGIMSFDKRHCEHCLTKTTKNKTTYFHYVLEAKLVTCDGFCLSLATEWIENPKGEFDKQDCERKAFERLAAKLKKQFPRLPICILADGLYPYENAFKICENNDWKFIFVLQDGSLKTVQEELVLPRRQSPQASRYAVEKGWQITQEFRYEKDIEYHKNYKLNWMQCIETRTKKEQKEKSRFEYITNFSPDRKIVVNLCNGGRLRWKIENEGFNTQKCGDYELQHMYNRISYNAMKNYYTLLQFAHAINQCIEKGKIITQIRKQNSKETIHNLWLNLKKYMVFIKSVIIDNVFRPAIE